MEKDIQFKKNFIWNIIGTGFNAFSSLFFMIVVTRINGVDNAGIFTLAFSTACILYMVGIYAGRIFQVTENEQINDKEYIINRIISCSSMIIFVLLFVIIKHYDLYKSSIFIVMCIYKAIEAFCDVLYGIMQKNDLLDKVGKSLCTKAITSYVIFFVIEILTKNMLISSIGIAIVWLLITCIYDFKQINSLIDKTSKVSKNNVIAIFKNGFFTFAISFLGLYMTNIPKYTIDNFWTEDIQAIFGIIIMPSTVMSLFAQFLIHPYLNKIFELYKANKYNELKKILYKIIVTILIIGAICSVVGYLLGAQVLSLIYGIDLHEYSILLLQILVGATFFTMAGIISPILITMRCTKVQFVVYIIISIIEYILCNILVPKFELSGATIAYLSAMILYFVLFYFIGMKIINKKSKISNEGGRI